MKMKLRHVQNIMLLNCAKIWENWFKNFKEVDQI